MLLPIIARCNDSILPELQLISDDFIANAFIRQHKVLRIVLKNGTFYDIDQPGWISNAAERSSTFNMLYKMFTAEAFDEDAYYDKMAKEYYLSHGIQEYPD